MDIRNNGKMKVLSLILSLVLIMGLVPTTVFAVPAEELWVNGANILTAANNTVACGSGTAVYDPATATIILNNAVIETAYNGIGINKQGAYDATNKLTIELVGANEITTNEMNQIHMGIYSMGTVSIKGAGSLLIETAVDSDSHVPAGIYAWGGCNITDSRITLKNTSSQESFSSAIDVNKFDASLQIINAIISIDNYVVGINVPSGDVTVQGSRITVANADCGISGGNEIDNFLIQGSVLDFTGEGVSSVGLLNGRDIQIDSSLVKIISQNSNAIYTDGGITVRNGSSLEMRAFYPALFSTLDTTITDSAVIAISTNDSGIYSRANILINGTSDILARGHWAGINANGNITINNGKIYSTSSNDMGIYLRGIFMMNSGDVYAQGATGFAAIGARYTKQEGDTEPVEKIVVNSNYADIGGGKVSVSDWYNGASGETTWSRSWSSFVAGNDNKLASDRSNALNEITIKVKSADYSAVDDAIAAIPADLSIYNDATANAVTAAKNAVVRGKDITEQTIVDGYVTAIENAVNALVYKGADYSKVDAAIAKTPADLSNYTHETVKAVNDAKNAVVRGKNITEQPIVDGYVTAIENAVNALVYKSADYSKIDEAIAKIPADLSIYTEATANVVTAAKNAVVRGKNITEQAIVDGYVTAIKSAVAALTLKPVDPTVPEIISGANQEVEQGKSATFTSNSDFANFLRVLIDGMEISSDKYTVKKGSTIVTLNAEFIKTLDKGKHTLSIVSTDGRADTDFTVSKSSKPINSDKDIPQTGDVSNIALWASMLFFSSCGVLILTLRRKKRV